MPFIEKCSSVTFADANVMELHIVIKAIRKRPETNLSINGNNVCRIILRYFQV